MLPILLICASLSLASTTWYQYPTPSRLSMGDSVRWVGVQVTLADSLLWGGASDQVRLDNSTWFRLDFSGRLGHIWTWRASSFAFTDLTTANFPLHTYEPAQGYPYNRHSPGRRTWDGFTAISHWGLEYTSFWVGIDHIQWGPARRHPLAWRGNLPTHLPWLDEDGRLQHSAPVPQIGFSTSLLWINYIQWTGTLQHHKELPKYFHAHRLDFSPATWIKLGIGETVIYGSVKTEPGVNPNGDAFTRNFEPLYALPFIPYFFAEHYAGDRDNVTMSFDARLWPYANLEIYAELFLDDLKSPTAFTDDSWWGNKWALNLGTHWKSHPLTKTGTKLEAQAEWVRIEPWVYTHHFGSSHRPDHFARNLATELGPNAMELWTRLALNSSLWEMGVFAAQGAKDSTHGSEISDIHWVHGDAKNKKFLNPATTRKWREWGVDLRFTPLHWLEIRTKARAWMGDFRGHRVDATVQLSY